MFHPYLLFHQQGPELFNLIVKLKKIECNNNGIIIINNNNGIKILFHTEFHDLQHILISSITLERSHYAFLFSK